MANYKLTVNDNTLILLQACVDFCLQNISQEIEKTEEKYQLTNDVKLQKNLQNMESVKTDLCILRSMMKHEHNKRVQWH